MDYLWNNPGQVWGYLLQHLQMTGIALAIAIMIAVPLSVLIARSRWLTVPVMGTLGIIYTIPSLALIILLVPLLGLNAQSVIAAMVLYIQVILVRNLSVALQSIDPALIEAAKGMGMDMGQRWWRVQVPLVLPIFLAGVRLSAIVAIAIATIGAKFGAGGLGVLLFEGIAQAGRYDKIWAGAIAVSLLALAINLGILVLERITTPPPLRKPQRSRPAKVLETSNIPES
ncbi:MAG: ABC transporter permease [Synechococcales cyanobacterium K44_A2020_017]|jgi:osmoprotectant transport system permease protein|nr:ABC transporter permease [Synechococcales cyanobacterium K32_A2020_035]MBF2096716.1 ABC transporter permease [Synechococcales cyanobacterium K44_A2020_017]